MDMPIALWTIFVAAISSSTANSNYVQVSTYDDRLPSRETQHSGVEEDFRTTRGKRSILQSKMSAKLSQ